MKVFLSLCLLFSLVTPVVLLSCAYCKNSTGLECSPRDRDDCPFDDRDCLCKSMVMDGSEHFNISKAVYSCSYEVLCDAGHYAITTANGRSSDMVVHCCHFNMCNSKPQELPLKKMEPNGLECVGCYSENKEKCEGTDVVKCCGDQTKCIKMSISYQKRGSGIQAQLALRGCATPIMCDKGKVMRNTISTLLMMYTMTVKCTDAL